MRVPEPIAPFHHRLTAQTRFNDFDMFGHLNNGAYLQLLDLGKVKYFEAVNGKPVDWHKVTVVVVNINCSFYSPAYFDEPLEVLTACIKISEHSFVLEQRVVNPESGDTKCVGQTVMAGFDPATATGAPIPREWAESLKDFENWEE